VGEGSENKKWSTTLSQIRHITQVMTLIVTCLGLFLIPTLHMHCDALKKERKMGTLLSQKNAVIYGASGAIGCAVARAFACEGATVFLTGRNLN
jgi:predicted amino acid dehydrogenase